MTDKIVMKFSWSKTNEMVWRITKDGICYRSYNGSGYNYHNIRYRKELVNVTKNLLLKHGSIFKFYLNTELMNKVK